MREKRRSRWHLALVTVALGAILTACSSSGSGGSGAAGSGSGGSGSGGNSVGIALVEPFSGDVAYYGQYANETLELALAAVGQTPGGHQLSFKRFDDQCTPANAQTAVRQIMNDSSITVAEGPGCTGPFLAAQPLYKQAGLPHVEIVFGSTVTKGDTDLIQAQTPDDDLMNALASYMTTQHVGRLAIVNDTSGYSVDVQQTLQSALAEKGVKPVTSLTFQQGATDFSGQISRLKSAHVTDVALGCYDTDCGHFVKQASEQGLDVRFWGPVTMQTEDFTNAIGSNYKQLVDNGKVIFASDFVPTYKDPAVQKFVQLWKSKYHTVPTTDIASFYVSHLALLNAIKSVSGGVTRANILPALKSVHLTDTPMGDVSFDSSGRLKCPPLFVGDWVNGQPTVVKNLSDSCSGLK